ncbi:MAG: hypothetical protein QM597_00190 [Aeromicrobium sp.]|uniref:hypothetical protein n=1 Tax=Aeromicrobium sp. TaxID=1871063 RepID=UPI0039E4D79D
MSKRAKIVLFTLIGLVVVALIAGGATYFVIEQNHKKDIEKADTTAAAYLDDLADFRKDTAEDLLEEVEDDTEKALDLIDEARDDIPSLGDAPAYGREHSEDYAKAQAAEKQVGDDLDTLQDLVEESSGSGPFLVAAMAALDRDKPSELLGAGPFSNGQPIRDSTIPGMQAVKDEFEAVEVPEGFEEAAQLTSDALQYVIDQLGTMATSLDGGQSYSFEYTEQYDAAINAVDDAVSESQDRLAEYIDAFGDGKDLSSADSKDSKDDDSSKDDDEATEEEQES